VLAMSELAAVSFSHQVTRLDFGTGQPYERFRARYEAAVPALDPRRHAAPAGRHALMRDVTADAEVRSPHGFVLYWRADMAAAMMARGELRPCTAYLMGNPAIAEDMYRTDPAVALYAPLRTLIYIDSADRTRFAVDQPSTVFAGFADPAIADAGLSLDRQLAGLLDALGVPPGPVLRAETLFLTAAASTPTM
jgi:Domain of unknown function DUF302